MKEKRSSLMSRKRKQQKSRRVKSDQPDLQFGHGELSGFTAAGVAGFHELNPAAVVRELLQNSLDAAREAGRDLVRILFKVEKHHINLVPGIKAYQSALKQAVGDQKKLLNGKLPDQVNGIVNAMSDCLKSRECTTLFVLDNGIGLDKSRMQGILADGLSVKANMGTGAVGNGHLTVIPASDLRYVLYGGRTENGEMVGSGHAILASHEQSGTRRSKDGFYVKSFRDDLFDPYVFPENGEIPSYIKDKLEWIADEWKPGAGAVVAVPGFNRFRENGKSFWDLVSKAAACNFFAAFATGELRIEFEEGRVKKFLDKSNIAATIEKFSTEKRTRSGFLSGSRALITFETIKKGEDIWVDTDIGRIFMRLHDAPSLGSFSRVELCRNGMWITDDLPKLQRHRFTDFKPFHCVILLNAADGEIHRIVRTAEGPLHNHLTTKWLSIDEKKKLTAAMEAVFQAIKERVPKYENEEFEIEDVLSITSYGISSGGRRPGVVGQFQEIRRPPRFQNVSNTEDVEGGPEYDGSGSRNGGKKGGGGGVNNNKRGRGTFRRSGNALQFSALPVPVGKRSYRVDLKSGEENCWKRDTVRS